MANTYSQIYIQIVFAVQGRQSLIQADHKVEIYKYIAGIIRKQNQKLIAIGGMPDHLHALIGMTPGIALSDLVRDVKSGSSIFINGKRWVRGKFNWQEGFGAFSYGRSQLYTASLIPSHPHPAFGRPLPQGEKLGVRGSRNGATLMRVYLCRLV